MGQLCLTPPQNSQSTTLCIGLIQSFEPSGEIGDIILGTPFLRNVYFVMGMDEVNATTGNFQKPETTPIDGTDEDDIRPRYFALREQKGATHC